jgi:molybdopterin-containing oxidoreductase family membrane subunit
LLFFIALEVFTVGYSQIPSHSAHLKYLFFGLHGKGVYTAWMWVSMIFMLGASIALLFPGNRRSDNVLAFSCLLIFIGTWIDKGLGMIAGGFTPSPLETVTEYIPTKMELLISLGVYAAGFFLLTVLYKVAVGVKREVDA